MTLFLHVLISPHLDRIATSQWFHQWCPYLNCFPQTTMSAEQCIRPLKCPAAIILLWPTSPLLTLHQLVIDLMSPLNHHHHSHSQQQPIHPATFLLQIFMAASFPPSTWHKRLWHLMSHLLCSHHNTAPLNVLSAETMAFKTCSTTRTRTDIRWLIQIQIQKTYLWSSRLKSQRRIPAKQTMENRLLPR